MGWRVRRNCSKRCHSNPARMHCFVLFSCTLGVLLLPYLNDNFVGSHQGQGPLMRHTTICRRAIIGCSSKRKRVLYSLTSIDAASCPLERVWKHYIGCAHFSPMAVRGAANRHPCIGGVVNRRSVPLSPRPRRRRNLLADKWGFPLGPRNERRRP